MTFVCLTPCYQQCVMFIFALVFNKTNHSMIVHWCSNNYNDTFLQTVFFSEGFFQKKILVLISERIVLTIYENTTSENIQNLPYATSSVSLFQKLLAARVTKYASANYSLEKGPRNSICFPIFGKQRCWFWPWKLNPI